MSIPAALRPAARSAYREVLRSARITFHGDLPRRLALATAVRRAFESPTLQLPSSTSTASSTSPGSSGSSGSSASSSTSAPFASGTSCSPDPAASTSSDPAFAASAPASTQQIPIQDSETAGSDVLVHHPETMHPEAMHPAVDAPLRQASATRSSGGDVSGGSSGLGTESGELAAAGGLSEDELAKRIEGWKEVALFLRRNVVQGQQEESGNWRLRLTKDTELGSNASVKEPPKLPTTPFPNRNRKRRNSGSASRP